MPQSCAQEFVAGECDRGRTSTHDDMQAAIGERPYDAREPVPDADVAESLCSHCPRTGVGEQQAAAARACDDVAQLQIPRSFKAQGHDPPPCEVAEHGAGTFWPPRAFPPYNPNYVIRGGLQGGMGQDQELAILFADVVGSTRLFEVLGDVAARDKVAVCIEIMRRATEQHGGAVVKTMGDEILATFANCDTAIDAAVEMQTAIAAHPDLEVEGQQITIRIGCHYGPVVIETRDVFGAAVHTANRMTSQAKAGQIIITDAIQQRLSDVWRAVARRVDVAVPRGQHEEVTLFEVLWQHGETTSMLPAIATITELQKQFRIRLRYLGTELVLDPRERSAATLGRGQENDLVIKGNLVSRLHARIEAGKNRFMLVDQSTNGTFVQSQNGDDAFVRRDAIPLKGQGVIGLGRVPEPQSYHTVEFVCEDGPELAPAT